MWPWSPASSEVVKVAVMRWEPQVGFDLTGWDKDSLKVRPSQAFQNLSKTEESDITDPWGSWPPEFPGTEILMDNNEEG